MVLYTPLSNDDIFLPANEVNLDRSFITFQDKTVCVEQTSEGTYKLIQLMSTDPQDFLNDTYMPGSILSNK